MGKIIQKPLLIVWFILIAQAGFAEYRIWTDTGGKKIDAEFIRVVDGKVALLQRDGTEIRVPLNALGMTDRKYAVLQVPPRIEIRVSLSPVD